jgi:DNA-binding GntR family transcriptional regulator
MKRNRRPFKVKNKKGEKSQLLSSQKAYFLLKDMILGLKLSPKDSISELKIAAMFGMSRTPVREALKRLSGEGLLISINKKGYFLNIPTLREIKDIYEVRTILEGSASRLAAQNIDLNKLKIFEDKFLSFKNDFDIQKEGKRSDIDYDFVKLGRDFHFFIIDSTGNEKLKELIIGIYNQLEISRIYSYGKRKKEALEEHLKIINALKERDGEKSQIYMEEHLKNAFNMLTKFF